MAAKAARLRASTGLSAADGAGAGARVAPCAVARRVATFHAATGIVVASATSVRMAFALIERVRMMCLSMAYQVRCAERRAPSAIIRMKAVLADHRRHAGTCG